MIIITPTLPKSKLSKREQQERANDINKTINSIRDLIDVTNSSNMDLVDTTLINTMNKKLFKEKEELVLGSITNEIQHGQVKKKGKVKDYYQVKLPELNKVPRSYTYEGLINKVYDLLFGGDDIKDYSISTIFKLALDEKARIKDSKLKTIQRDINTYNLYITEEFGSRDIRDITYTELCMFIQERTKVIRPDKHSFINFKCILNLIFRYASNPEHLIINNNPVPSENSLFVKNITINTKAPEDKAFQPDDIELIRQALRDRIPSVAFNAKVNAYAILFSTYTGMRVGELCSLAWDDVYEDRIHIHSQMINDYENHHRTYKYEASTKNEKGYSRGGRYYPIFPEMRQILDELKELQEEQGVVFKWVFSRKDGTWMTTHGYTDALNKLCHGAQYKGQTGLNLKLSNNHAIRMYVNSYLLDEQLGINAANRARLLGHSVQTNLNNYTFARADNYIDDIIDIYNDKNNY